MRMVSATLWNLAVKECAQECTLVNNVNFTVLVSGGGRCHWVSMCTMWPLHARLLRELNNKYISNFESSLNIPPQKLFGWFRRPQLWATGDWQLHQDNVPAHASRLVQSFLVKHQITQVTQPRYSPDCNFRLFPKLKSPLKGKRLQIVNEIQENTTGQLMATGRTMWGPKVPTLRHHCLTMYLASSSINVSYFSCYMDGYFLDRPCT